VKGEKSVTFLGNHKDAKICFLYMNVIKLLQ